MTLYIARNYLNVHRSPIENLTLHIVSDTPVDADRIRTRIHDYHAQELDNLNYMIKRLTGREIIFAVIGAALLAVWVLLAANASAVRAEILCIMGWVPIWNAVDIAITDKPELHRIRSGYRRAVVSEIIIEEGTDPQGVVELPQKNTVSSRFLYRAAVK